jgi:hypothetical protein
LRADDGNGLKKQIQDEFVVSSRTIHPYPNIVLSVSHSTRIHEKERRKGLNGKT